MTSQIKPSRGCIGAHVGPTWGTANYYLIARITEYNGSRPLKAARYKWALTGYKFRVKYYTQKPRSKAPFYEHPTRSPVRMVQSCILIYGNLCAMRRRFRIRDNPVYDTYRKEYIYRSVNSYDSIYLACNLFIYVHACMHKFSKIFFNIRDIRNIS